MIITLTDVIIHSIEIIYGQECVKVQYSLIDENNKEWIRDVATFWRVIPPETPVPDNWFQLPETYIPTLVGLRDDANAALIAKFLT